MEGMESWRRGRFQELLPPLSLRLARRPKKSRNKDISEIKYVGKKEALKKWYKSRCNWCGEHGHNIRRYEKKATGEPKVKRSIKRRSKKGVQPPAAVSQQQEPEENVTQERITQTTSAGRGRGGRGRSSRGSGGRGRSLRGSGNKEEVVEDILANHPVVTQEDIHVTPIVVTQEDISAQEDIPVQEDILAREPVATQEDIPVVTQEDLPNNEEQIQLEVANEDEGGDESDIEITGVKCAVDPTILKQRRAKEQRHATLKKRRLEATKSGASSTYKRPRRKK